MKIEAKFAILTLIGSNTTIVFAGMGSRSDLRPSETD
jgi:hypothetical protein